MLSKLMDFFGMEIKQTASKINSTLQNTKKTATVGNSSSAPEDIFTPPTHWRLSGERKNSQQLEILRNPV